MIKKLIVVALICALGAAIKIYHDTMRDPIVRPLAITSDRLTAESKPIVVAMLADIHVAGPDMPPRRLARIVDQVNALEPDLVAIAGDLISEKFVATKTYSAQETVAPLAALRPRLGTIVVPGNHDHWSDWVSLRGELLALGNITVLENQAAQIGPLALGGVDDAYIDRADLPATMAAMRPLKGPRIVVTHSPDIFPNVPVDVDLVMAGHTHCGQIAYPWGGSPATMSDYGELYACGVVRQHGKTLVTSAGLGTSLLPIRLFTQPEIWLIEIRPSQR